ncbi:MAG TPA: response regulator [Acidiferrobacter sp.]|nr:response regulator [Acidiferrobacter sp.]
MSVKKVLVVDDSLTDLKNIEQIVIEGGYSVITATSGAEAVKKATSEQPDAIPLDVVMKDMNGFQACRLITSGDATKAIPVVLVSSKGEKTDRIWGEEQGAKAYIVKPFTKQQILDTLKSL